MERRNFLRTLCILPAIGLVPSLVNASVATSNGDVVGLEKIITIIQNDVRLNKRVDEADIADAIASARRMNEILVEAIIQTGVANDKKITTMDARELNDYIFHNFHDEWVELHGDDEDDGEDTGFHKVVNNGARTKLYGRNAVNKVADGIYHLGFDSHLKNRLLNEDGNKNSSYAKVASWLDALLREDLEAGRLANPDVQEVVGDTDTGLDYAISIIYNDVGLQKRISIGDMRVGAASANTMNEMLLEAISETNAAEGGAFTIQNVKDINAYLVANHADTWAEAHGDDEETGEETGFHKVQNDGAKTRLYGKNAVNKVLDGIYHLGFETNHARRLLNEDGNKNVSFKNVALWLNNLLSDELSNQTI
ncbi:MAG: hypothetical protein K0U38_05405 [Epsilonproteobacteria bacterium]|nr:hypothetical protein [Campylobacterota bacterium]